MNYLLHPYLLAAVVLWFPFPFLTQRFRMKALQTRYLHPEPRRLFGSGQNYIDLVRSSIGAWLLLTGLSPSPTGYWPIVAILLVGLLIQMIRLPSSAGLVAPLFYLSGITLVLSGLTEGCFALLFGWALATGAKDFRLQLPAMGSALLLVCFFNRTLTTLALLNAGLILLPVIIALLFNQRFVFLTRESRSRRVPRSQRAHPDTNHSPRSPATGLALNSDAP